MRRLFLQAETEEPKTQQKVRIFPLNAHRRVSPRSVFSKSCCNPFPQELAEEETRSVVSESSNQAQSASSEAEEDAVASGEDEEVPEDDNVDNPSENKPVWLRHDSEEEFEVSEDNEASNIR